MRKQVGFRANIFAFLLLFGAVASYAGERDNEALYSDLFRTLGSTLKNNWRVERAPYGLRISSLETTPNTKLGSISSITLEIEGAATQPNDVTLEKLIRSNINGILKLGVVDKTYKSQDDVGNGIGAVTVDINGTKAALIDYQLVPVPGVVGTPRFARHGILLKDNRSYTLTMIYYDPNVDRTKGVLEMSAAMIAMVNSGKL